MKKKKGKRPKPYRAIPLLVAAILFSLTLCSCAGAPKSRADFEAMDTARYENWKARLVVVHEEAAVALVKHSAANVETVDYLAAAYTALAAEPVPPGAFQGLADEFSGLLRFAVLEVSAFLGDGGLSPSERLSDVLAACAAGLAAGRDRALAEIGPAPPPDPDTGP